MLDWELSTLGDPMADFAYLLMQWTMPGLDGADFKALNIPTMDEAEAIYCKAAGVPPIADSQLIFLLQPVPARRHRAGHCQAHRGWHRGHCRKAQESASRRIPLAQAAWAYAQKAGRELTREQFRRDARQRTSAQYNQKIWRTSWVASRASPSSSPAQAAASAAQHR